MEVQFANLSEQQKAFIVTAKFDRMIVTSEQAAETAEVLELDGKGSEELTAIRNAVVKHLAGITEAERDSGDWDELDRLMINLSAITAVIDNRIFA